MATSTAQVNPVEPSLTCVRLHDEAAVIRRNRYARLRNWATAVILEVASLAVDISEDALEAAAHNEAMALREELCAAGFLDDLPLAFGSGRASSNLDPDPEVLMGRRYRKSGKASKQRRRRKNASSAGQVHTCGASDVRLTEDPEPRMEASQAAALLHQTETVDHSPHSIKPGLECYVFNEGDYLWYHALVIGVDSASTTCTVRFQGSDYEVTVPITWIKPLSGEPECLHGGDSCGETVDEGSVVVCDVGGGDLVEDAAAKEPTPPPVAFAPAEELAPPPVAFTPAKELALPPVAFMSAEELAPPPVAFTPAEELAPPPVECASVVTDPAVASASTGSDGDGCENGEEWHHGSALIAAGDSADAARDSTLEKSGTKRSRRSKKNANWSAPDARNPHDKVAEKYWAQRFRLFSLFDRGIKIDDESFFSITPEAISEHIAERCRCDVLLDPFCGVGGNVIQFAFTCHHVIAIDIDPTKIAAARHNAKIYGVHDRIEFIVGDAIAFMGTLRPGAVDVVYLSPPWGGPVYLEAEAYDVKATIQIGGCDGEELFRKARRVTRNVAYFLPRTSLAEFLASLADDGGHVEVEDQFLNGKLKTRTAYYGDLARR